MKALFLSLLTTIHCCLPDMGFCPVNCRASLSFTESPAEETLLQARKELLQEMLEAYKEYQKLLPDRKKIQAELDKIALREKQRADSGFNINTPPGYDMPQEQRLKLQYEYDMNMLEHKKDAERKQQLLLKINDFGKKTTLQTQAENIFLLNNELSLLDELTEKDLMEEEIVRGLLQVRKKLHQEMLALYKEYQKERRKHFLLKAELDQIEIRLSNPRSEYNQYDGDQLDRRKNAIMRILYNGYNQEKPVLEIHFEFILTGKDVLLLLDELIQRNLK
jgi:hypothetical protein